MNPLQRYAVATLVTSTTGQMTLARHPSREMHIHLACNADLDPRVWSVLFHKAPAKLARVLASYAPDERSVDAVLVDKRSTVRRAVFSGGMRNVGDEYAHRVATGLLENDRLEELTMWDATSGLPATMYRSIDTKVRFDFERFRFRTGSDEGLEVHKEWFTRLNQIDSFFDRFAYVADTKVAEEPRILELTEHLFPAGLMHLAASPHLFGFAAVKRILDRIEILGAEPAIVLPIMHRLIMNPNVSLAEIRETFAALASMKCPGVNPWAEGPTHQLRYYLRERMSRVSGWYVGEPWCFLSDSDYEKAIALRIQGGGISLASCEPIKYLRDRVQLTMLASPTEPATPEEEERFKADALRVNMDTSLRNPNLVSHEVPYPDCVVVQRAFLARHEVYGELGGVEAELEELGEAGWQMFWSLLMEWDGSLTELGGTCRSLLV